MEIIKTRFFKLYKSENFTSHGFFDKKINILHNLAIFCSNISRSCAIANMTVCYEKRYALRHTFVTHTL